MLLRTLLWRTAPVLCFWRQSLDGLLKRVSLREWICCSSILSVILTKISSRCRRAAIALSRRWRTNRWFMSTSRSSLKVRKSATRWRLLPTRMKSAISRVSFLVCTVSMKKSRSRWKSSRTWSRTLKLSTFFRKTIRHSSTSILSMTQAESLLFVKILGLL